MANALALIDRDRVVRPISADSASWFSYFPDETADRLEAQDYHEAMTAPSLLCSLALSLEVIKRIRNFPLTPSSDFSHLVESTSLLFVSESFRDFCLPLLCDTVVVSKPFHWTRYLGEWTRYLGEGQGLFVLGAQECKTLGSGEGGE